MAKIVEIIVNLNPLVLRMSEEEAQYMSKNPEYGLLKNMVVNELSSRVNLGHSIVESVEIL